VVLDTLGVHQDPRARAAIEAAGCHLRFLPPDSPDLNPIELAFATLKTHLRGVAARAFEPLLGAIGTGLDRITPADIVGDDRHCGFPLPRADHQPSSDSL